MHLLISILYSECSMNNPNDLSNQVISPEEIVVESTGATSSMNVIELTAIINRYAADIDKIKGSLKEKNAMFKDAFEGDAKYHEQDMKVKDLNKLKMQKNKGFSKLRPLKPLPLKQMT